MTSCPRFGWNFFFLSVNWSYPFVSHLKPTQVQVRQIIIHWQIGQVCAGPKARWYYYYRLFMSHKINSFFFICNFCIITRLCEHQTLYSSELFYEKRINQAKTKTYLLFAWNQFSKFCIDHMLWHHPRACIRIKLHDMMSFNFRHQKREDQKKIMINQDQMWIMDEARIVCSSRFESRIRFAYTRRRQHCSWLPPLPFAKQKKKNQTIVWCFRCTWLRAEAEKTISWAHRLRAMTTKMKKRLEKRKLPTKTGIWREKKSVGGLYVVQDFHCLCPKCTAQKLATEMDEPIDGSEDWKRTRKREEEKKNDWQKYNGTKKK